LADTVAKGGDGSEPVGCIRLEECGEAVAPRA
jgi:hypothetical protein